MCELFNINCTVISTQNSVHLHSYVRTSGVFYITLLCSYVTTYMMTVTNPVHIIYSYVATYVFKLSSLSINKVKLKLFAKSQWLHKLQENIS